MLSVDKYSRTPIYEQIIDGVMELIAGGEYRSGDQLPSVRALSQELSVNPNTLQKAYAELERMGLCHSVPGNGRFISPGAADIVREHKRGHLEAVARLTAELKRAGIPLEEIIACVRQSYGNAPEGVQKEDRHDHGQ